MYLFTKVSPHGNTDCPPKVCSSPTFAEQWLPVRGISWDFPPWCCEAVIFINVTAVSCLWEIHSGTKIVLDFSSNKVKGKVLRARIGAVLATSVIQSCCCNSVFPPSLWCFLLPGAGFLSHQTVGGLVGANPQRYATHLVEFFWSVAHSWCGHFYFGCIK